MVGDLMVDEHIWGTTSRVSPEAPVLVVDVQNETGFDFKDIARLAIDAGVPDEEIALFIEEVLSNEELNG